MKISLAQINPVLGDFNYNAEIILDNIRQAKEEGSDLIVFPECSLFGYYPADLLERESVVHAQIKALDTIKKKMPKDILALVGFVNLSSSKQGKIFKNSAALIEYGKIKKTFDKTLLPTYDVFDERRHFEPGDLGKNTFKFKGKNILVSICEDIWAWNIYGRILYAQNPILKLKDKYDLMINLSASPYTHNKSKDRKLAVENSAKKLKCPVIYVNQVGAQDETVFDGGSFISDKKGMPIAQLNFYKEDLLTFDFDELNKKKPIRYKNSRDLEILTLGIKDFFRKTNFTKAHLGLSGGIDSALVLALATRALGKDNVKAIALPTEFNSDKSLKLAKMLCANLGVSLIEFPIQKIFEGFRSQIDETFQIDSFGLVHENLQARIRASVLMAFSNQNNSMLLSTSNKSEMAVGYTTLYGDMCGGLAPIGDLTKCQVYDLSRKINLKEEVIPEEIISRPPSAELRPNQKDQDFLPDYKDLDKSVIKIVEKTAKPTNDVDHWTLNALMKSEFKRWQAPPILKVTDHAFGRGRRFPIAHKAYF